MAAPADARISVEMRSAASNGYRFGFGMEDRPGRGPAAFGFWKASEGYDSGGPGFLTGASYIARRSGSFRERRLTAEVGALGAVDARFEQSGVRRRIHRIGRGCREVEVIRRGRFVGRIDFAGEGGYAEVHRKRLRGRIDSYRFSDGCRGHRSDRRVSFAAKAPAGVMRARGHPLLASCGADPDTGLIAGRGSGGAGVLASSDERANGIRAVRYLFATGDHDWFRTGPNLRRATIQPTLPAFTGTARYARGALTGDLRVSLPGLDDLPLTPGDAELGLEDDVPIPDCYPFGD
ncbi:MAG TPA: hypothetical protein VFH44_09505 [Solirubrobacterales bacterium]|nr:hypothetical protein [Solirubrobacterales bacterium]